MPPPAPSVGTGAQSALAAPNFSAPYACGQRWTYRHHSAEVRLALDFGAPAGSITNIYIDHPSAQLPGVPTC